ncbi:MAG: nucleotide sugar dehydrogenase [Bacteroidales bacterium]|nr:nucleotide sugar dehydrogenase [Bacteroidales bacterium]MDD2323582.1 nucleotide sugar dehydrogenase [Bacteroidales bacterium]MDD3011606.1 nucleotide sugar dehydrogenase [Bacteroidales bacterium]MDD3962182.1 nucleotide sugar dehydrogenase [Bacteroidales bacterium]MDY0284728.1 nucleotide sugar dehydrogenase [Bacteroidales bacterium]
MTTAQQLLKKIEDNTEVVGIIGLGYVGLPLAVSFAEAGVKTLGFDKNPAKVEKINHGDNYIQDIRDAVLREVVDKVAFSATTDFSRMAECDALIIAVPTPLDRFKKPDMRYIESACTDIGRYMKPGTFICLESTTYPTTTEDFMLPIIGENLKINPHFNDISASDSEATPKNIAPRFFLAYSPERVDPGNPSFHTRNTPKVLGAMTPEGLEIGTKLYSKAIDTIHPVSSPRVAEMVKILENTYRLINISLINELALLAGKMDINIWEVIEAAKTKPFGFQAFYPGPGIGGHCIPLDPFYLEHIAKKYNFDLSMIHTAGHINMRMPHYMYIKIATALNRHKKAVNGSTVLFLGVAYKPNINDERESPALEIMDITAHKGGNVQYHDPHIPVVQTHHGASLKSIPLTAEALAKADVVVLTTNHSAFDVDFIQEHSQMIVDMRNMIKEAGDKVYKL